MYRILQEEGIDLPRYAVLKRDPDNPEGVNFIIFKKKRPSKKFFVTNLKISTNTNQNEPNINCERNSTAHT